MSNLREVLSSLSKRENKDLIKKTLSELLFDCDRELPKGNSAVQYLADTLGDPYTEVPICDIVDCFISSKKCHYDEYVAKNLLMTIDSFPLPHPSMLKSRLNENDILQYRVMYARWEIYCRLPDKYESLLKNSQTKVFGKDYTALVGAPLARKLRRLGTKDAIDCACFMKELMVYAEKSRLSKSHKKRMVKFHDGVNLLVNEEWVADDFDVDDEPPILECYADMDVDVNEDSMDSHMSFPGIDGNILETNTRFVKEVQIENVREAYDFSADHAPPSSRERTEPPQSIDRNRHHNRKGGESAKSEERNGTIAFYFTSNNYEMSQKPQKMLWMLQLQSMFSAQLPKMPKEYITRIVFDARHTSLMLVKKDKGVIGGICFRQFANEGFSEIVFCAITASEQVKGYGTYMMNHLKDYHVRICKVYHFLTYADEFALGYFQKQGFTVNIPLPKSRYTEFIKDYEGATLMGCELDPNMLYTEYDDVMKGLREAHQLLVREMYPSLDKVNGGIGAQFKEAPKGTILEVEQIPGFADLCIDEKLANRPYSEQISAMKAVLNALKADDSAWPFLEPVKVEEVAGYYDYIHFPMDLKTAENRLKDGYYVHERLFIADIRRMFANCYKFNASNTVYYQAGHNLNKLFNSLVAEYFPHSQLNGSLPQCEDMMTD